MEKNKNLMKFFNMYMIKVRLGVPLSFDGNVVSSMKFSGRRHEHFT